MKHAFILVAIVPLLMTSDAHAKKGLYFGLGIGGVIVSGDTGIGLKNPLRDKDYEFSDPSILVSTEEGEGIAFDFRIGYNILGFVALELDVNAGGNNLGDGDKIEGQGGIFGLLKLFPAQLFEEVVDRWWDPYVMVGGGIYFMAYQPQARFTGPMSTDGRGWYPSTAIKYGLGCDFYLSEFFSLGLDLGFTNGFHSTFIIDDDEDLTTDTSETASSFAFQPSVKLTFHFLTSEQLKR